MDDRRRILAGYLKVLLDTYGSPPRKKPLPALDELVLTILSQNTNDTNRDRAYSSLRKRFPTWKDAAEAEPSEIEDAIRVGGLALSKSRNIHRILSDLIDSRGSADLDYLSEMDDGEAMAELVSMRGVGTKTAACVLVFSLGRDRFPVDTHIHRIVIRWGVVPQGTARDRTQEIMEELVSDEEKYQGHLLIIEHGRRICRARSPHCEGCPLTDCPRIGVEDGKPKKR